MVYLGLGSNLGDRAANLEQATRLIKDAGLAVLRRSSLYETEPRDVTDQPWFLNMVLECETRISPVELMQELLRIELEIGRDRSGDVIPGGPRLIDIDLLLYNDVVWDSSTLIVPHPRIITRRFVLEPLLELSPEITDPRTGEKYSAALPSVRGQKMKRLT